MQGPCGVLVRVSVTWRWAYAFASRSATRCTFATAWSSNAASLWLSMSIWAWIVSPERISTTSSDWVSLLHGR
jgi:hypothetical protein